MAVASLLQHAVELGVRKMLHQQKEWDRERVAVASLMQHAVELGVRKTLHHCHGGIRKDWDRERVPVASAMQQAVGTRCRGGGDVASLPRWPMEGMG